MSVANSEHQRNDIRMTEPKLPPGYSLLQSFARTYKQARDPIGTMTESMARFGGTYSVTLGSYKMIGTQDPGFIDHVLRINHRNYHKSAILTEQLGRFLGKGLLTSNGEYWLKQRRLIQPGFHAEKIRALHSIIRDTVDRFLSTFPFGDKIDVYPLMNTLAFEIVINTLFNVEVPHETRMQLSRFITETQDFVIRDIRQPYNRWWFHLSGEVRRNLREAEKARTIIRSIIVTRQQSGRKYNDLLDMLLDARYEDTGLPMEERQVIDEILILLIAGHETTANALSWTLFLLSRHIDLQDRLREETGDLSIEQIVKDKFLNAVLSESMRLYPPAWISDRVAMNDDVYREFKIPAETIVILYYYGLHRDPQHWDKPELFDPGRFMADAGGKSTSKIFYPFGAGPRLCIGNSFAISEMTISLQALVRKYFFLPEDHVPTIKPLVTLRPDQVLLKIVQRR